MEQHLSRLASDGAGSQRPRYPLSELVYSHIGELLHNRIESSVLIHASSTD